VTPGNVHDVSHADVLLEHITAGAILGDKGYDSDAVVAKIEAAGALAVIPSKSNRKVKRDFAKGLYKERNVVERFFNRIKQYRGLATRYEKTVESFLAMVHLVCARLWVL
jgi:transposase